MSTVFHNILRAVASAMEIPVVICLLLALAFAAFSIGWWLTEMLGERRHLSTSLLTAFDTTIAWLIAAAVCLCISTVRRRWYSGYMADLETLLDCVTEMERAA